MRSYAALGLALLALLVTFTLIDQAPPQARSGEGFSASRAAEHVTTALHTPRPPGSAEHDRVHDDLLKRLRELGLQTRVQESVGITPIDDPKESIPVGAMRNIVAVLPGTAPTGRIVLAAHYDSVPSGPGSADDGAGVATILEVVRTLPKDLRNDVVVLLTDGEESGLMGAEAFVKSDPLAKGNIVVLNHEARGVRGPVMAFRTSPGNAGLMSMYGSAAPHPAADSGTAALMRILPNDTDFTVFTEAGWTGIDSAFVAGGAYYHTPLDDPAHLDRGTLQMMGDNTLALTAALGRADLAGLSAGGDSVYFTVPGALVRYPAWLEWPIALLALAAAVLVVAGLRRRGLVTVPRTLVSAGLALVPVVAVGALAFVYWPMLLVRLRPEYAGMFTGDPYRPWFFHAGLLVGAVAIVLTWYGLLRRIGSKGAGDSSVAERRERGGAAAAAGALLLVAVLGVAFVALLPGGSHNLTLPALGASIGWLVAMRLTRPVWQAVALTVGLAPAAVLLCVISLTTLDLGVQIGGLVAAPQFTLFLLLLLPLVGALYRKGALVPVGAVVVAAGLVVTGLATDSFDAAHPRQGWLNYSLDAGNRTAAWATLPSITGVPWLDQYTRLPEADAQTFFGDDGARATSAPAAPLRAPELTVLKDETAGGTRTLTLRLTPTGQAPITGLSTDADVVSLTVEGRDLGGREGFTFHRPPADGLDVTLVVRPGKAKLKVYEEAHDLSVVPGYVPPPAGTVNLYPQTTVFQTRPL
ncbi:M20/M25/M40 family metallo-hydrolase [Nonomuraea sp. NPDC046570]|uniref:M20/M25/M40 family metallo-hydrolase n=1 Tax=Nonomuraea sp. NPDC046570 TaxID=3155255 RepID=UPI0033CDE726